MKKTAMILVLILLMLTHAQIFAQEPSGTGDSLPQLIGEIPDPSEVLGSVGSLYQPDFQYIGNVYDAYLFPKPEQVPPFVESYSRQVTNAGYEAVADMIEGYEVLRIYDFGDENTAALLFYNYQGYMLFMVPKSMSFTLHTEVTEPLTPDQLVARGNQEIANGNYQTALQYLIKAAGEYLQTPEPLLIGRTDPTATPTPLPAVTRDPGTATLYTVQEGDTCWSIAASNGMDVQVFMEANSLTECNIIIGDQVIIPAQEIPTPTPTPLPGQQQIYVVQEGDTCYGIAVDKFGVNWELFMSVNGFTECSIRVGDEVIIPGDEDLIPTMTPIPLDQYAPGQQIQYTVQMNDSYNDIAAKFNTTLVSIQQLNNVNVYTGFPQYGQVLTIAVNLVSPTPSPEAGE